MIYLWSTKYADIKLGKNIYKDVYILCIGDH